MGYKTDIRNIAQVRVGTDHLDPTGGQVRQVKFAKLALAAATADQSVVAAVAGKKIRVLKLVMGGGTNTCTVTFWSDVAGGSPVQLTGSMLISNTAGVFVDVGSDVGLFETVAGKALIAVTANVGGAGTVQGYVVYVEV